MKVYDVNVVADYAILRLNTDEEMSVINLKLQKLVYYIQAWSLGIHDRRLIDCDFEAWAHGPVCRVLYDRFKGSKNLYSFITREDVMYKDPMSLIDNGDLEFIDYILDNYGGFTGSRLESMTHREAPWIEARGNAKPMESCYNVISEDSMRKYYGERWKNLKEKSRKNQ